MNIAISENAERMIRSELLSGRFASEEEVVEEAIRRLASDSIPRVDVDPSIFADQEAQRRLFAAGLLSEIKPSTRVDTGTERFTPIVVEGEPLSEMILRERR